MFRNLTVKFLNEKAAKRFIALVVLILFLWLFLISISVYLENHQSNVVSIDDLSISFPGNINVTEPESVAVAIQFKEYKSRNNDLWISFPQAFSIREEIFEGRDLIYHLEMQGEDDIHGYVQIWQLNTTMLDFLNNAKKFKSPHIHNFIEKEIAFGNNIKGYQWRYEVQSNNGDIVARQSFLSKPGSKKMYVISLYIPKDKYTEEFDKLYNDILYSVKFR